MNNPIPNIDINKFFDTTTTTGQVIEFAIYAAIAAVVTFIVLLIYSKFVKQRLKGKIQRYVSLWSIKKDGVFSVLILCVNENSYR